MKKIKTTVTYKVSDGFYCNLRQEKHKGFPANQRCRFCTQVSKNNFVCVLHNMPLVVEEGCLIRKDKACIRNMAYKSQTVPDVDDTIQVDPKTVMKMTLQEYRKAYKQLIAQGYPDAMADKLAQQMTMGGN